jgi:Immunoglobulin domain
VLPKLRPFNTGDEPLYLRDSFQLFCSVINGDSPFTFEWLFQNATITSTFDLRIENSKKSSTLTIDSVSAKHSGEYVCRVLNRAGFATISTALVVKGLCGVLSGFSIVIKKLRPFPKKTYPLQCY